MLLNSFYKIENNSLGKNGEAIFNIKIDKKHKIYKGHFPDHPITPGAVMLQILRELAEHHFKKKLQMQEVNQVKFLSLVNPNIESILVYTLKIESSELPVRIKNTTTFPDNRIVLKCNATFVLK